MSWPTTLFRTHPSNTPAARTMRLTHHAFDQQPATWATSHAALHRASSAFAIKLNEATGAAGPVPAASHRRPPGTHVFPSHNAILNAIHVRSDWPPDRPRTHTLSHCRLAARPAAHAHSLTLSTGRPTGRARTLSLIVDWPPDRPRTHALSLIIDWRWPPPKAQPEPCVRVPYVMC